MIPGDLIKVSLNPYKDLLFIGVYIGYDKHYNETLVFLQAGLYKERLRLCYLNHKDVGKKYELEVVNEIR
jgi:hypothetical protein